MFGRQLQLLVLILTSSVVVVSQAGEITGTVQFSDGSKAAKVAVSGLVSGALGGSTPKVYTDGKGRFRLTWTSKSGLAKVYVRGNVVATNVKDGADVTLTIK